MTLHPAVVAAALVILAAVAWLSAGAAIALLAAGTLILTSHMEHL